jgi:hypothetical protein
MKTLIATLLLLTASFAQTAAPATAVPLLGTWKLVSINVTLKDGSVRPDATFGPHAKGFIMYQPDGYMCANIMNPDHMTWKDVNKPTSEEKLATFDGSLSYCGEYKLDAEHSMVTHYPKVAWSPKYVGSTQPRPFHIDGNLLTITPPNPYPDAVKWVLVWERVK